MAGPAVLQPTPEDIGVTPKAPFAIAPDPARMFETRAARFRALAVGHPLGDYLGFLAELSQIQHDMKGALAVPKPPPQDALERAYGFGMPPIDRGRFEVDSAALAALTLLLDRAAAVTMPEPAAAARARLAADESARLNALAEALESAASGETLAEHVFASAALQVHFARLASLIDASRLQPVGVGACPCCGGPPVASLVVGWTAAHGVRFVSCALCGTLWNHVRIKCVACDSTGGVAYQTLTPDGETAAPSARDRAPVKAETCDDCRSYLKIMHQHLEPDLDPVADDVATLGLDVKLREKGWMRAAFNPYLLGY